MVHQVDSYDETMYYAAMHHVDLEWLTSEAARPPEVMIASSPGQAGIKRLAFRVDHYYETVRYAVIFNNFDVPIGGDGGLADAVAVYNAIDEDRPC